MNKQMTREQFIASFGCGENYRPKEITDRKFYFFKGYIIGLYKNGGYSLYKDTVYNSTKEGDILKKAMNRIVELELKEFDERENLRNKVNEEIQKRVEPFITEIVAQVLKGQE